MPSKMAQECAQTARGSPYSKNSGLASSMNKEKGRPIWEWNEVIRSDVMFWSIRKLALNSNESISTTHKANHIEWIDLYDNDYYYESMWKFK